MAGADRRGACGAAGRHAAGGARGAGGDAQVTRKLGQAWNAQPAAMAAQGLDAALFAYIGEAMRAAGLSLG